MLKEDAADYFVAHVQGKSTTFDEMTAAAQSNFSTPEFQDQVQEEWNTITLDNFIAARKGSGDNTDKIPSLDALSKHLRYPQQNLPKFDLDDDGKKRKQSPAAIEAELHSKLKTAVSTDPDCISVVLNPPKSYLGLLASLRVALNVHSKLPKTSRRTYNQHVTEAANDGSLSPPESLVVDRRYHGQRQRQQASSASRV